MKELSDIIPGIKDGFVIDTDDSIAADEQAWQESHNKRLRDALELVRSQELSAMNVPHGTLELMSRTFNPKLQPGISIDVWREISDIWMNSRRWVVMIGPPGVGKTDVAIRLLWKKRKKLCWVGTERFLFIDSMSDVRRLADRYGSEVDALWDRISDASYMVLDDVGHALSPRHITAIKQIIMWAEKSGCQMIITSNCTLKEFNTLLGGAIMSRLSSEVNKIFSLTGRDVRKIITRVSDAE